LYVLQSLDGGKSWRGLDGGERPTAHRLDLLRWFLGEAEEVFAFCRGEPSRLEAEAITAASLRFPGSVVAEFFCDWAMPRPGLEAPAKRFREAVTIYGREGTIYAGADGAYILSNPPGAEPELSPLPSFSERDASMWEHFADCVRDGTEPLTSGAEGRASLELVLAIYRSAGTGDPVRLPLGEARVRRVL
jgi:UDP-N-acetyl-2-amino-2-deoxyglucuronate dehydrogenase